MNDFLSHRDSQLDRKDTETTQLEEFIRKKYEVVAEIVTCSLLSKVGFLDEEFRYLSVLHHQNQVCGQRLHPGEALHGF